MYICIKLLTNQNFKMKNLLYLFIAGLGLFAFTACGSGETTTEEATTEAAVCSNTGEPCLADHSCCVVEEVELDDSTTVEEGEGHSHEGHDHDHDHDAEDHDHE